MTEATCRMDPAEMPIDREDYERWEREQASSQQLTVWHHKENLALQEEAEYEAEYWRRLAEQEKQQSVSERYCQNTKIIVPDCV